jgi:hypothetical protein
MNQNKNDHVQGFPDNNPEQGEKRERPKTKSDEDFRQTSDANPLRDGSMPNEHNTRQGNSSIPLDEEDTLGIP